MDNLPKDEFDFISLPRNVCILNTLAMGVAIQILAKITGEEIKAWKSYVGAKASEQYSQLSAEEMQKIINELKSFTAPDEAT
ncbi:hypothetical protein [Nostoc sp. UHCC 0252]|uniref:hypothetical protein n=1 Tax=Nostoc sp. UHCC 0252 TaxID=3110241 RepID=UPI002B202F69|nr:hypothetical protein [Nostoc sp. UHCC 0252]MEA5601055.1 hypothetical protein [Nostoc sp. UHCC 0252]